jgi:hypothetical protein
MCGEGWGRVEWAWYWRTRMCRAIISSSGTCTIIFQFRVETVSFIWNHSFFHSAQEVILAKSYNNASFQS